MSKSQGDVSASPCTLLPAPLLGSEATSDVHCLPSSRMKYGTSDISPQSARGQNPTLGNLHPESSGLSRCGVARVE